jgi:hypothetical protein
MCGSKESILRNCVQYNHYQSQTCVLIVKAIYKVFSNETLAEILLKKGWKSLDAKNEVFEIVVWGTTKQLIMDKSGVVYVSEIRKFSDGDESKGYDQFALHRLGDYLKEDIPLKNLRPLYVKD